MIILPISLTMAAGAAILNIWLMMRVGRVRGQEKVSIGDGGNERVIRRMRAHSNFVENTAVVLILLALIELATGPSTWLWAVGSLYLIGRILHAIGMDGMMWARMAGTVITMLTQLGLAGFAIFTVYATPVATKSVVQGYGETTTVPAE
ncbi:MAPEG family protein [Sphingopyxis sp. KK2]|uniref:MAPEG family protein n=1 Tax=Sphingopyxis sp. KK2 TaxID=1855727 RepID=UPI00097E5B90|nr:MAPEG family protein [Sphingopyxis sp. KK2]